MTGSENDGAADVQYANLSAFQRDVLLVLKRLERREEDSYGLGIKRHLESRYDESVNHGRLYPNLDKLTDWGLIECGEIDNRTNRYTLSERGETLLRQHAEEISETLDQ